MANSSSYWKSIWFQFRQHRLGMGALLVVILFCLAAIYAPFLASSKPLIVIYRGSWFFPLFRYLFYMGFYTKYLDIFYNLLIFTLPAFLIGLIVLKNSKKNVTFVMLIVQIVGFFLFSSGFVFDPTHHAESHSTKSDRVKSWNDELDSMTTYEKLNLILRYRERKMQNERFIKLYQKNFPNEALPTLWEIDQEHERNKPQKSLYLKERQKWMETESQQIDFIVMPLLSHFHWEDNAGGNQQLNQYLPWWEITRTNRKDLLAALIFGTRISLIVGFLAVTIALAIGIPVGSLAGFYGGNLDILISRMVEIWEAMPTFFMLLLIVAMTQSKSIFLVIGVIGFFGWTHFCRFIRGEFFKQRNLPYVEACRSLGFRDSYIMFSHILPNAIPPLLTLTPFAIMGAISTEAGLSFLGLGEEGSCSWGVLMDEGRNAFPAESYLLWPPAILLTILLIAIALVGDALRDSLDPKMHIANA